MSADAISPKLDALRQTPEAKKQLRKLDKATKDVEALFLKQLVGELRKSAGKGMLGEGFEADVYADFLDDAVARQIGQGGGIGIGKMLYSQMENALLRQMLAKQELSQQDVSGTTGANNGGHAIR